MVFHNISSLPLHISVDFSTGVTVEKLTDDASATLIVEQRYGSGCDRTLLEQQLSGISGAIQPVSIHRDDYTMFIDGYLIFRISIKGKIKIGMRNNPFKITFKAIDTPVDINVIKPTTLLNRLLKSINGGNEGVTGEISIPAGMLIKGVKMP